MPLEAADGELVYEALIFAIRSNWGVGFHNSDQGHPSYAPGAGGEAIPRDWDGPDRNELFMLVRALSRRHGRAELPNRPVVETWEAFCALAYGAYLKDCDRTRRGLPQMRVPD